jgi:hypothetical protein
VGWLDVVVVARWPLVAVLVFVFALVPVTFVAVLLSIGDVLGGSLSPISTAGVDALSTTDALSPVTVSLTSGPCGPGILIHFSFCFQLPSLN